VKRSAICPQSSPAAPPVATALAAVAWPRRWRLADAVRLSLALLALGTLSPAWAAPDQDLVFEAELCREMTSPWRPVRAEGASGGLALSIPEGAGSSEAFDQGREGRARFAVPTGSGGERELWLRVYWNGNCSNSLFVLAQPESRPLTVDSYTMRAWHWVKVPTLLLPAAATAIDLINREDGVWVDQLCVRPVGQPAPIGVLSALAAWPPPGPAVPAVSLVAAPGGPGVEALPPTEYLLHHLRLPRLNLPRQPVLVVFPGQQTPLEVWLRQNRPAGLPGSLRLEPTENLIVEPATALTLAATALPLDCHAFTVRAHPALPRGLTYLYCRVQTADGLEQLREIRVLRPYRWLLSQAFPLNPAAGLDQLAANDAAVLTDSLGSAPGITWHEAEPKDFTPFGLLDLRRAISAEPFVQAYAFTRCRALGGPATLDLTHDDWIRVWVNGACVYSDAESAPSTLTRTRVPVTLRAGDNDLLVRCAQLKNYWEFGLVAESADETATPAADSPIPAALTAAPAPLPRWSFQSIIQDLPALVREAPPGQGWTVFAAACREGPLTPADPWRRLSSAMQSLARDPGDRQHCAEALLELRRRVDLALLPEPDRAFLHLLTFRDRIAFLTAGNPFEAAEESLAAACWTDSHAEQQALRVGAVRLYLCAAAADEATACIDSLAADLPEADALRGVLALYRGDWASATRHFPEVRPDQASRYASWLLNLGRAPAAEWLLRRVRTPSLWNRLAQAAACIEQRRFAEGETLLLECLRRDDSPRSGWETAAAEVAAFYAARGSLPQVNARLRAEAEALSHHRQPLRGRLLNALWRLDQEAQEPVAALRDALAEADLDAGGYRPPARQTLEGLLQPALSHLLDETRYAEVIDLCNQTVSVAPGLRLPVDIYRLQALRGLGRTAAAAAVQARLMAAVAANPTQTHRLLSLLRLSLPTTAAAERLDRLAPDRQGNAPAPSAEEVEPGAPEGSQVLPGLVRMLAAGVVDQIAMESGESPCIWIVEHGKFPFCVELGAVDTIKRFETALRPFGAPLPVGREVAFLDGLVWIGTDCGLFCYHRDADAWDRLHLPAVSVAAPVLALTVVDNRLQVTWSAAHERKIQGTFTLDSGVWETVAAP
jgi:hypothetical protein